MVKQVTERGYRVTEVADRLGVTTHSIYTWIKIYGPEAAHHQTKVDEQAEIRRLMKELKRVTAERDILKKPRCTSRTSPSEVRLYSGSS